VDTIAMHIKFQRTELVDAEPDRLWQILTDYESYPRTNPLVTRVRVLHRDVHGAEVEADRKVFFEPRVHFFDTYSPPPLRQLERRYATENAMRSVWTVEPANAGRAYFTIVADANLPPVIGWLLRPLLARMFYRLNFPTFIRAAEQAAQTQVIDQPLTAEPA
jgi:ribosome-associated toxin RatA of RatAB toxin-antitoxin module